MSQVNMAVISENSVYYGEQDRCHSNFTKDKISQILEEHITMVPTTNNDDMMQLITESICGCGCGSGCEPISTSATDNVTTNYPIHTSTILHTKDTLYQMCHIAPMEEVYKELKNNGAKFNGIASHLSDTGFKLYNKAVIFKIKITHDEQYKLESITQDEITDLFISKFIHIGTVVNTNGSIDECKYIYNPVDWIGPSEISKYKYHEVEILGKVLMIFIDTEATTPNELASKLYSSTINGRAIVAMRDMYTDMTDPEIRYCDLDAPTFKRLVKLCSDSTLSRQLTDDEDINGQIVTGKRVYINLDGLLNKRGV